MKTVVFASTEDCIRTVIAASFFDAFTLPTLVRAVPVSNRRERTPAVVTYVMGEIGLHVPEQPHILDAALLDAASLIVTFGDLRTPSSVRSESWDVPLVTAEIDQVRMVRDALRKRVWRLVAQNGWYRLQPAQAHAFRKHHDAPETGDLRPRNVPIEQQPRPRLQVVPA